MTNLDRRGAERHAPPKPVPATFGGFAVRLIEIALTGCSIEHGDRLPTRARLALRFAWRGEQARVDATVVRSELTSRNGKPAYLSGLEFCASADAAPSVIRDIVGWLVAAQKKAAPPPISDPGEEEPEVLSAKYLRCTFGGSGWSKLFVDDPSQPADGFTIPVPPTESETDTLCRTYEKADPSRRHTMRVSFERTIRQMT